MNKKRLMGIAGLASALLLMGSCTSELSDDPVMTEAEAHRGEVTFSLGGLSNTLTRADGSSFTDGAISSTAIENNVKKIYAIIFKATNSATEGAINDNTNGLVFHRWVEWNLGSDGNLSAGNNVAINKEFSFRLKDDGKYAVLFLANAEAFVNANIAPLGEKNKFVDGSSMYWYGNSNSNNNLCNKLISNSLSTDGNLTALSSAGLAMRSQLWYFNYSVGSEKITLNGGNAIPLKRLAARIDIENQSTKYITLQRVRLINRRTSSLLGLADNQSTAVESQTPFWQFNGAAKLEAMIYTYENNQKTSSQIPSLYIEYTLVGQSDIKTAEVKFEKKQSANSDTMVPVSLQRNHLYKVIIKIDAPEQPFTQGVIVQDYVYGTTTEASTGSIGNNLKGELEKL